MTVDFLRRLSMAVFPGDDGFDEGFCAKVAAALEEADHKVVAESFLDPEKVNDFTDVIKLLLEKGDKIVRVVVSAVVAEADRLQINPSDPPRKTMGRRREWRLERGLAAIELPTTT